MNFIVRFFLICLFIWLLIALLPTLLEVVLPVVVGIGIIGLLFYLIASGKKETRDSPLPKEKSDDSKVIDV